MVREGQFREDLLFRLYAFNIELPPLRKRPEDLKELCFHYVNKLCSRYRKEIKGFSPEFFEALGAYEWPGNVRELVNALESALAVADDDPILFPKHLPMDIRVHIAREAVQKKEDVPAGHGVLGTLKERREAAAAGEEQKYLKELMAFTGGNIAKACEISGLSRVRLYVLLKKYNILRKASPDIS
jgi:two-component system NtrC family response regulator